MPMLMSEGRKKGLETRPFGDSDPTCWVRYPCWPVIWTDKNSEECHRFWTWDLEAATVRNIPLVSIHASLESAIGEL